MTVLRAATRGSALARWQTDHVAALLARGSRLGTTAGARRVELDGDSARDRSDPPTGPDGPEPVTVEAVVVDTTADRRLDVPIWKMGGKGVFVKEVQAAVLDGRARIAVHSGKDLPSVGHPDLVVAAVPRRADPRDVLVGSTLGDLAPGSVVATGSARRRAQLAWLRPDLTFTGLRGNIATRLDRIPTGGAVLVAAAALDRLGLVPTLPVPYEVLDPSTLLPQVAQGALAIECRVDDDEARSLLARIDDPDSRRAFEAERAFLRELGADCDLPAGALATVHRTGTSADDAPAEGWARPARPAMTRPEPGGEGGGGGGGADSGSVAGGAATEVTVEGMLASLDGHVVLRATRRGRVPAQVGAAVARHLLDGAGGRDLLAC